MNNELIQYLIGAIIVFGMLCIAWGVNFAKTQELLPVEKFTIAGVLGILFLGSLVYPLTIVVLIIFALFMICCGKTVKKPKYARKSIKHRK